MTVPVLDETHDQHLRSWVDSANDHSDFPIQNLPFGIGAPDGEAPRGVVAIGDWVLDLGVLRDTGLLDGAADLAAEAASAATLNRFMALGAALRQALRRRLSALLAWNSDSRAQLKGTRQLLLDRESLTLHLPAAIGDYTDFYAGIHHATRVGGLFRPEAPLLPNYKHVPIGYHGRASSVRPSDIPVRRPRGQYKSGGMAEPAFGPCRNLDFELELGIWVGTGTALGEPVPIADAARHIAGYCLLNDWSARDVQAWEYQPLGPFLAKNFHTTVSPWVITPEALAPFRLAQSERPDGDPKPLPYLWDQADQQSGALSIRLEVTLTTAQSRDRALPPDIVTVSDTRHLYWTPAQLLAHHSSGGCDLRPGDLFGSGTISGPDPGSAGSLLELTAGGTGRVALASGETRRFLEDGDEVTLSARCDRAGFVPIGFGTCRATVLPAR